MKCKKCVNVALSSFLILNILNIFLIMNEFNSYNSFQYKANKNELQIIINELHQISDSIYENIINSPSIIKIYEKAYSSTKKEQAKIRDELYRVLNKEYENFKKYGVQQLHFHLPNNESFLRFHRPEKFGDKLTKVRDSVKYVNEFKKPIFGFEEGKIFNGYRFVYPLFDEYNNHIGSVEISSSLLNIKDKYEINRHRHIDFILTRSTVEKKVFSSELTNYKKYHNLDDFLVQNNIHNYNQKNCKHIDILSQFIEDENIEEKIKSIDEYTFSKIIDYQIYTMDLIPLYNDFLDKKIGYIVIFSDSNFIHYFYTSIIASTLSILFVSFLIGFVFYQNSKSMNILLEKQDIELHNEHLLSSNQLIKSVIDGTNDLIFYKDKDFVYMGCNDSFANFIGKSKDSIVGKTDFELFDQKTATLFRSMDTVMLQKNEVSSNYEWVKYSNGDEAYMFTQKIPFKYDEANSDYLGILGIARDLTELYKVQQKLKDQAYIDELTQINNRKSYNERIFEFLEQYKRYKDVFSIIMFDIDDFKSINDTYGHAVGDKVLVELCQHVLLKIRQNDYFFRIGGEEFIVLLTKTQKDGAITAAEGIRKIVEDNLDIVEGKKVTISLGVTTVMEGDNCDTIFHRVDSLLYKSKNNGKNTVTFE